MKNRGSKISSEEIFLKIVLGECVLNEFIEWYTSTMIDAFDEGFNDGLNYPRELLGE